MIQFYLMAKINCFFISHCSEIMKKNITVFLKVKTKSLHTQIITYSTTTIFNYKPNYFPRTDKT